jgi:hypothetical protein
VKENGIMEIISACGADAVEAVDKLGFAFLAEHGYPEAKEAWSSSLADRVRKQMSCNGHKLFTHGFFDDKEGQFVVWFTLQKGKRVLATSSAVRLQGKPMEGRVDAQG